MNTELEKIEKMAPAKLFKPKAMGPLLKAIEVEALAEIHDVETTTGRDSIKSLAYKVARSKTTIDNLGKDFVAEQKQAIAIIDEVRRTARAFLDDLKDRVRQPLTDWEEAESERVRKIQGKINYIRDLGSLTDDVNEPLSVVDLEMNLKHLRATRITKVYQEYQDEALAELNASTLAVIDEIPKRKALEAEWQDAARKAEAEQEEQRIENEQRIAREAVEAADLESKRELEQRDAAAAKEKAKTAAAEAWQEARERNTKHKGAINRAAVKAIQEVLPFVTDDDAKKLVKAIVAGNIPNVTINY